MKILRYSIIGVILGFLIYLFSLVLGKDFSIDSSFGFNNKYLKLEPANIILSGNNLILGHKYSHNSNFVSTDFFGIFFNYVNSASVNNDSLCSGIFRINESGQVDFASKNEDISKRLTENLCELPSGDVVSCVYSIPKYRRDIQPTILLKMKKNGQIDTGFSLNRNDLHIFSIANLPYGKLLILGQNVRDPRKYELFAVDSLGNIDNSFTTKIFKLKGELLDSDGKLLVNKDGIYLCSDLEYEFGYRNLIRLDFTGNIDTSFNFKFDANNYICNIKSDSNGDLFLCGNMQYKNKFYQFLKINNKGQLDAQYSNNASKFYDFFTKEAFIADFDFYENGKIIVVGTFDYYAGKKIAKNIALLNSDGTISHELFNWTCGFDGHVSKIKVKNRDTIFVFNGSGKYNSHKYGTFLARMVRSRWNIPNFIYYMFPNFK